MNYSYSISFVDNQPELITLQKAKDHLKVRHDYENDLIASMLKSAIQAAEDYTGIFILKREVEAVGAGFDTVIPVVYGPVIANEVTVTYLDADNEDQTLENGYKYRQFYGQEPAFIYEFTDGFPEVYQSPEAVKFTYTAGILDADSLPAPIYSAIMLFLADLYEYRVDRSEIINTRANVLLRPYKKFV